MRSRPFKRDLRDRIEERTERHLYACKCPRRRIARQDSDTGRLLTGTASCSRHRCGRAMRLWWRMKRFAHKRPLLQLDAIDQMASRTLEAGLEPLSLEGLT